MKKYLAFSLLLLAACGPRNSWDSGLYYFDKGLYPKAIRHFERFLAKAQGEDASRAYLAMARCYAKLSQYQRAEEYYEKAARNSPFGPSAEHARLERVQLEQYLPLSPGIRWEEADTETRGRNMYAVNAAEAHPGSYLVRRKIYAGIQSRKLVREVLLFYSKEPGLLWERAGDPNRARPTLILAYPYREGASWPTWREGRRVRRTITRAGFDTETPAGHFGPCLEIAESYEPEGTETLGSQARIYDTYCAKAGRVRTAAGDDKKKSVFSELIGIYR